MMSRFHDLPRYLVHRGAVLSALMLAAAALLPAWAACRPVSLWLVRQYAGYLQSMSAVVLGVCLLGALALEDILRRWAG